MKKSFLFLAATALIVAGCGKKVQTQEEKLPENVQVLKLEPREINRNVEYSTTLAGYEEVNIAPSVSGNIEHIYVEPGKFVSAGTLLVRIDQTQLNSSKVQLNTLGVELARTEALLKSGNVAQSVYDQLKSQYDVAVENMAYLEKNTFVKAPFSGVIAEKNYEDGELYSPTKPILKLSQLSRLKAYINIPESYYPVVKQGMPLEIVSDIYPNDTFKGKIEIVYPTVDASTHTFMVKLDIPNVSQKLRPGMFARTTLALGKVDAIVVPYQAVLKQQGSNDRYVFINDNGEAKRIAVTLGQRFDDQTEIISPEIKEGGELVVIGQARLVNGAKLNVKD
ncbi:MAG: efflux RND transporter periplasmic adaptor subunit [Dysgonamonadaceae bacterium]|jgi:RND family efflux transporter MFP subunit|nr:efflux RND transporter periplasmic adaptor subunit [Dysgonamonadaceae bacterium]